MQYVNDHSEPEYQVALLYGLSHSTKCFESNNQLFSQFIDYACTSMTGNEKIYSMSAFNRYIDSSEDPYKLFHLDESDYSWLQIRRSDNEMSHIADIAMRLNCSTTSEASCERTIKRQRKIHSPLRMRSDPDLLDARMTLNSL